MLFTSISNTAWWPPNGTQDEWPDHGRSSRHFATPWHETTTFEFVFVSALCGSRIYHLMCSFSHWTKPPIPLETPHNTSRSHVSGTSPYTLNRMTDNLRERGNASGSNRTARATVLPLKPPIQTFTKLSGMFAGGGAGTGTLVAEPFPSRHFPSSGTGKGMHASALFAGSRRSAANIYICYFI